MHFIQLAIVCLIFRLHEHQNDIDFVRQFNLSILAGRTTSSQLVILFFGSQIIIGVHARRNNFSLASMRKRS